ncbi:ABC transporter permease [Chryseolinea soli]|uniref:ABC transporter permease n=1 Tax=Chryseolinea soli TaxID=2321403 RepID=A0A385SWS3_9BACT|nr:ABC transporter permease [Chryseolinea soli]AYB34597.1 ABC transporter permease [Chryseolinea soli]
MIRNYLKSAVRSTLKNKVFTIINVLGLAVGLAGSMLITRYVMHELSYDQDQLRKDRIFRVQLDRYSKGEVTTRWAAGAAGIGPELKNNFPEVEYYVRMCEDKQTFGHDDVAFKEEHIYYASEDFFKVFSFPLVKGVDSTVLREPHTMAVSKTFAKKYFGDEDPIGKMLRKNGVEEWVVTGVFEDVPGTSHMRFDALLSFSTYLTYFKNPDALNSFHWDGFMTYVQLYPNAKVSTLQAKLPAFVEKREGEGFKKYNAGMVFTLEPITRIHLFANNLMMDYGPNGNGKSVYFLAIIAAFILVIAWINYVNLATARSMERAREVGVRKVLGGLRSQLIWQFLLESFIINLMAFVLSLVLVRLLLPTFAALSGRNLDTSLFSNDVFLLGTVAVFILGVLSSGLYPAFVLSGFKPAAVLKGKLQGSPRGKFLRKGLVVFQFAASITLIVGTFTVYRQLSFMRNSDKGVNIDQTIIVRGPDINDSTYVNRFYAFHDDLTNYPEIVGVTASTSIPGRQPDWNAGGIRRIEETDESANEYRVLGIDQAFVPTFGLELIAGRNFSKEIKTDRAAVLFNESAIRQTGFKTPKEALNEQIFFWGDTFKIVGVLKDYRQESMKRNFEPLIFRNIPDAHTFYSIHIKTSNVPSVVTLAEEKFKSYFPGNPFQFFFMDDYYNQQYQADIQFGKVFGVFATLAIFIACMGLFGLSSYMVVQRTKEIGVRKVLGATVSQVIALLCKEFALLVAAAIVIAVPVSWLVMNNWLNEFANRISLSWWIFAVPGLLVMAIAWATISLHTFKAASANPVDALRYE